MGKKVGEVGMSDRDEVIKGLEKVWDAFNHMEHELYADYVFDALALLKEQDELLRKKQKDIDRLCNEMSEWKHKFHDTLKEQEAVNEELIPVSWLEEKLVGHSELPYAITDGIVNVISLWNDRHKEKQE